MILSYNPDRVRYEIVFASGAGWRPDYEAVKGAGGWRFDPLLKVWFCGHKEKARQFIQFATEQAKELLQAPDCVSVEADRTPAGGIPTGIRCFVCGVELQTDPEMSGRYSQPYLFCVNCDWVGFEADRNEEEQMVIQMQLNRELRIGRGQQAMEFDEEEE